MENHPPRLWNPKPSESQDIEHDQNSRICQMKCIQMSKSFEFLTFPTHIHCVWVHLNDYQNDETLPNPPNRLFFKAVSLTMSPTCTHKNVSTLKAGRRNARKMFVYLYVGKALQSNVSCTVDACTWSPHACSSKSPMPSLKATPGAGSLGLDQIHWTTQFTTIQNMSFDLVLVSSYHGSATWSFNGHATDFTCDKSSSPPGSCGGLIGAVGESVDMSTEPSGDICGINKKDYLEYAFNPLVLTCPNPHPCLLQRHHGIAHYSII